MTGPDPALAAARSAVRQQLAQLSAPAMVLVAVSGGPDSLALAAATGFIAPRLGLLAGAVVVDHDLQADSAPIAAEAARTCVQLGLDPVRVVRVAVPPGRSGLEAAARTARYAAFEKISAELQASAVLMGHTQNDQAETVLLRLSRGSGTRSLAGMAAQRGRYWRPFLGLTRAQTEQVCQVLGLAPWRDPQNQERRFLRVRARAVLAQLEQELGPGVVAGLARSAAAARIDAQALDEWADREYIALGGSIQVGSAGWAVAELATLPAAIQGRVLHRAAVALGCPAGALARVHIQSLSDLISDWHGQGPVDLPGGVTGRRACGRLLLCSPRA